MAELDTFAAACAKHLNPGRLERIARDYRIVEDTDAFTKQYSAGQSDASLSVARAIVEKLNEQEIAVDVAETLYFEMSMDQDFQEIIAPLTRQAKSRQDGHEALLRRRDHFLSEARLELLLNQIGPQVCCIVGDFLLDDQPVTTLGTGFLVGPDLIMTASHVVETLVLRHREADVPAAFKVVFDHKSGEPIDNFAGLTDRPSIRVVNFHRQNWLVMRSEKVPWDGTVADLDQGQIAELQANLDFALIRLAEPVGNHPRRPGASKARGWIELDAPQPAAYGNGARVVMPQHPQGFARKFDFGVISAQCPSGTRIVYDLEADRGTSGAPCLNMDMGVIGIHVAAFQPHGIPTGNVAVRFDVIWPNINGNVPQAKPPTVAKRAWRVAGSGGDVEPILGRGELQKWLHAALSGQAPPVARSRSDRIYAADAPDDGAGKTFTVSICKSVLATEPDDILIVLGGERELLPDRLEDFVVALAAGFGLTIKPDEVPQRPGVELPKKAADGDKVDRWASQKLPQWFADRLAAHRPMTINKSVWARARRDEDKLLGRQSDPEVLKLATAAADVIESKDRWRNVWIVIDDLARRPMSANVTSFVAGLIGADIDESAVTDVRATLRWLLLGRTPDFLVPEDYAKEVLSPEIIVPEDLEVAIEAAYEEAGISDDEPDANLEAKSLVAAISAMKSVLEKTKAEPQTALVIGQALVAQRITAAYRTHGRVL